MLEPLRILAAAKYAQKNTPESQFYYVSASLSNFVIMLVPVYSALPAITGKCSYACSYSKSSSIMASIV